MSKLNEDTKIILRDADKISGAGNGAGRPSYSLTKTLVITDLDDLLGEAIEKYGLTHVEVADILAGCLQRHVRYAAMDQRKRSPARSGGRREDQ